MTDAGERLRPGRRSGRRAMALSLAAAGVVLAGALVLGFMPPRPQRRRLPDGSTVALQAVTYGEEPTLVGGPLAVVLYRVVPEAWRRWLPVRSYPGQGPRILTFYVVRTDAPEDIVLYGSVADEHGCESGAGFLISPAGESVLGTEDFARRGRALSLRLFSEEGEGKPLAEWHVPNPDRTAYAHLSPGPLPATATTGGVTVTLRALHLRRGPHPMALTATGTFESEVDVSERGHPSAWEARHFALTDATGSDWGQVYRSGPGPAFGVLNLVSQDEKAVRVRVDLVRTRRARFGRRELFNTSVAVPRGLRGIDATAIAPGGERVRLTFMGPGPTLPARPLKSAQSSAGLPWGRTLLILPDSAGSAGAQWSLLDCRDQGGRSLMDSRIIPGALEGELPGSLPFRLPAGVRRMQLRLAIHRPRTVEFTVPVRWEETPGKGPFPSSPGRG